MTIEYLPVGVACNLKCNYCYQDPMRDAGNISMPRDWQLVQARLLEENHRFTVFGGEPLLASMEHLREVFEFGFKHFGGTGIQTNGVLINDDHIEMFKELKVTVGISVDGPEELNKARGSVHEANIIHANIVRLSEAGIKPSLIITLTRYNASPEKLPWLVRWVKGISEYIQGMRVHLLESETPEVHREMALSDDENTHALLALREVFDHDVLKDIRRLLVNPTTAKASCVWNACDPLTTKAVKGVGPDGTRINCGRVNKDGVEWVKAKGESHERYFALYHTPQEFGGCKDCRFFALCNGNCPGTGIDNDWRNRTEHCQTWKDLFELVEKELIAEAILPITRKPGELKKLELAKIKIGNRTKNRPHGDVPHGDIPHGDIPHGDSTKGVAVTWR